MKRYKVLRLLAALLLAACSQTPGPPLLPWGDAEVVQIVQIHGCTVYGLATDPEHVYWTVCQPQP